MSPLHRNSGRKSEIKYKVTRGLPRDSSMREDVAMCSPMPDEADLSGCFCSETDSSDTGVDINCPVHGEDISVGDEVIWTLFEAKDMDSTPKLEMSGRVTANLIQDNGVSVVHVTDESSSRGYWIVATDSLRRTVAAGDAEIAAETLTGD